LGLASTYSHYVTIHYDALCRPTLDAVLEQLQALRAALRRTTEPLAPYDIEALIVRKASIGTAKNWPRSPGPAQGAGLRSPILQQQGTGVGSLVSRSTHAGRMYQQQSTPQQRQHRAARRSVSTPQIQQPGGAGSPQQLRSAVSSSPHQLTTQLSSTAGSVPVTGSAAAAVGAATAPVSTLAGAAGDSIAEQQQQLPGMSMLASSYPGAGGLAGSLHHESCGSQESGGLGEGYADGSRQSSSGRSIYLEHSASTGDNHPQAWPDVSHDAEQDESCSAQPQLSSEIVGLVQPRQLKQQHSGAVGSFTLQPSGSNQALPSSSSGLGGCPFAAGAAGDGVIDPARAGSLQDGGAVGTGRPLGSVAEQPGGGGSS
jgi:hypothetical protein